MAKVKPFYCIRPNQDVACKVAALPYDVYNREEAKKEVEKEPMSFLKVDRAETQFNDNIDIYDDRVYQKAKEMLDDMISKGVLIHDLNECYYVYELILNGRSQTGLVACADIDDYLNNVIKKHENTREDKEQDRIRHVDICDAQTGPIFLAYRSNKLIHSIIETVKVTEKLYGFTAPDGIVHNVWRIDSKDQCEIIKQEFEKIDSIYIADGHHRAASAVKVGLKRRNENPEYTGEEEYNTFLSVLFPEDQLMIMSYNRVIKDLNGLNINKYIEKVSEYFIIEKIGNEAFTPSYKGSFGMYIDNCWYKLVLKEDKIHVKSLDSVESLDVSILQNYLLNPILGIGDPRIDKRIDFIGGIRGLGELEKRVNEDMEVAFSMYPTSINELFAVSDAGKLMPPKSTWFEPKLRSGLFIHKLT